MKTGTSRRKFIEQSGLVAMAISAAPLVSFAGSKQLPGGESILRKLAAQNDATIAKALELQIKTPGNRWHGGSHNTNLIPNAHSTKDFIVKVGSAYACPYSKYYRDSSLEGPLLLAAKCLLNVQYEDGTVDLYSTNHHSTPDTAFIVNYLSPVYVILKQENDGGITEVLSALELFFKNAGKCLTVGGAHTANHRWVISAALARLNDFFPSKDYLDRIDDWLAEGIDQDPDGQYTERSVAIYSPTCDDMFLTMGRSLNRNDLFDVVRKNLDMTLFYIQPGGEVLTDASGRQDSTRIGYVNGYYYSYLYFAIKDQNPVYAAVCGMIEQKMPERITRYLPYLLEDENFRNPPPNPSATPDNYFKRFAYSGVTRIRRENLDISIIENNPTFFSLMKGNAVLQSVRLCTAFFGSRGQFISRQVEVNGETVTLTKHEVHGYFQPYPKDKVTGDGDYSKLGRLGREMSEAQEMDYRITISESGGKARIEIEINGTDHVPVSMELSFRAGGALQGVDTNKDLTDAYFLTEGIGKYVVGKDAISFGPGKADHRWAEIRGMLPKQEGKSVYLTGYTPFKHVLEFS